MSKTFAHRLSEGWPPLQSIPGPACRSPLGQRRLPGVPAPSAHADAGAHLPGICLVPVRVRLQGFSPSCRVSSPASFRPVRAGDAHGVLPFEASPSGRSRGASRRPLPSCRCSHSANVAKDHVRPRGKRDFRALLPAGVRHGHTRVSRASARCSPEVSFALGHSSRALPPGFPVAPLLGFGLLGSRRGDPASQGLDPLSRCCAPHSED
jgi:hypothetical protein